MAHIFWQRNEPGYPKRFSRVILPCLNSLNITLEIQDYLDYASKYVTVTPEITLEPLRGGVVIDEIQRFPRLFETLRPLADLGLNRLFIIYPGKERYRFHEKIEAIPLIECVKLKDTELELGERIR